ncbi:putative 66 kDa stress protein [Blattamonas nauphoetae]|uniref:66 kDa stress protein n=1 Tax=Blattamonas nauphoetae TaxID=2049346 RepID=A0ABQ9YMD5_9EUKA|nr:putative 66 kDa stress protein [Blattamonas nauphoetae]
MSITINTTYVPNPNTERGKPTRLTSTPSGEEIVYGAGNAVIVRSIKDPMQIDAFYGHRAPVQVARYCPSGYYCASADAHGRVLIWSTGTKNEKITKLEKPSLSGGVNDLSWSDDSKRVLVVGEGKDKKAEVFNWDTGTSLGDISGHTAQLLAGTIRPCRPYRVVTAGEDKLVNFYKGPPFKYDHSVREHQKFVNSIEYASDGSVFVTGGGDKTILLYDGTEGTVKGKFSEEGGHKLSVFSLAFSKDNKQLFSCSADKTMKLWDVETMKCVSTFQNAEKPELLDTPMGCTWTSIGPVVVTLRGDLLHVDTSSPTEGINFPAARIRAQTKGIQQFEVLEETSPVRFITCGYDSQIIQYTRDKGTMEGSSSNFHNGPISSIAATQERIVSLQIDGTTIVSENKPTRTFVEAEAKAAPIAGPQLVNKFTLPNPRGTCILSGGAHSIVAGLKVLVAVELEKGTPVCQAATTYDVTAIAASRKGDVIAVGSTDQHVHFWKFDKAAKTLVEFAKSKGRYGGSITAVAVSADSQTFAAARDRNLCVGPIPASGDDDGSKLNEDRLLHTSRITSLAFSLEDAPTTLISVGLDCQAVLWDMSDSEKFNKITGIHTPQGVTDVKYVDAKTFATTGTDGFLRVWNIE